MLRRAFLILVVLAATLGFAQADAPAASSGGTNLYANPSFESSLSGWSGYAATPAPAGDGVVGSNAVRVSASGSYASIYPYPRPVTSTVAGTAYTAGGWVRSDTPGRTLCLRIREWGARSAVGGSESCVRATTGWAQFAPVVYTTIASGGSLESYVYGRDVRSGDTFEVDGMSIALGTTPASTPPPAPAPTPTPVDPANLYSNGEFDSTVDGWAGYAATVSQRSGSMHVTATGGWPSAYPSPRPVLSTATGTVYAAGGSVRSDTPGRTVCLRIREWGASTTGNETCLVTTASWQTFGRLSYAAAANGSSLESYVYEPSAYQSGDSFDVDHMTLAVGTTPAPPPPPSPAPVPTGHCGALAGATPNVSHVIWVWMENRPYQSIVGSSAASYENQLVTGCGLATSCYGISHPSLPNYVAATSGSTQGIADDNAPSAHPLGVRSIFDQVPSWKSYQESMPSNCLLGDAYPYAVKHNPAAYYTGLRSSCATNDVPLGSSTSGALASDLQNGTLPSFSLITPNMCSDTHDCSVTTGDDWLKTWIPLITSSTSYRSGSTVVVLTWDEDDYSASNRVAAIVISPYTVPGTQVGTRFDHYALLRTTEELLGTGSYLGAAATAPSMRTAFGLG